MNRENPAFDKAFALAIRIVNTYKLLCAQEREFVLSKQLPRSETSIGTNLAEANGAISDADLSAKISIAYNIDFAASQKEIHKHFQTMK